MTHTHTKSLEVLSFSYKQMEINACEILFDTVTYFPNAASPYSPVMLNNNRCQNIKNLVHFAAPTVTTTKNACELLNSHFCADGLNVFDISRMKPFIVSIFSRIVCIHCLMFVYFEKGERDL